MRIFLTGVSCVGKSTIGKSLAKLMDANFFDLDLEIEAFFNESIERLQKRFLTMYTFRVETSKALAHLLSRPESFKSVISMPASALQAGYLHTVKKAGAVVVAITDSAENILERITFYDIDSIPIQKTLTQDERRLYLKEIKKDITFFAKFYKRAHLRVDITGLGVIDSAAKIKECIEAFTLQELMGAPIDQASLP